MKVRALPWDEPPLHRNPSSFYVDCRLYRPTYEEAEYNRRSLAADKVLPLPSDVPAKPQAIPPKPKGLLGKLGGMAKGMAMNAVSEFFGSAGGKGDPDLPRQCSELYGLFQRKNIMEAPTDATLRVNVGKPKGLADLEDDKAPGGLFIQHTTSHQWYHCFILGQKEDAQLQCVAMEPDEIFRAKGICGAQACDFDRMTFKTECLTRVVGAAPSFSFGTDEQRKHPSAKYPDSSVDLISATVDTQKVKFHSTPQVHMGSEDRSSLKNAEILRTNAELAMGMESPGALEYFPKEIHKNVPAYSFASKNASERKPESRVQLLQTGTPRTLGPGSHKPATSMGKQPASPRPSAPAWTMSGRSPRDSGPAELLAIEDKVFSSIGKQVLSTIRSPPGVGASTSTRDQSNRTALFVSDNDRPYVGPKPTFRIDLPARSTVSRPGL